MLLENNLNDHNHVARQLAKFLKNGSLVLVIGAGISKNYADFPSWEELIDRLYKDHDMSLDTKEDFKGQAETLRVGEFNSDTEGWKKAVHKALYRDISIDFEDLSSVAAMRAISSLAMTSIRGGVRTIVTLNYDNLVELFLEYHGFVTDSVHKPQRLQSRSDVSVLHPHGYLPFAFESGTSDDIVLDRQSYSRFPSTENGKLWSQEIREIIRKNFCLYLGVSLTDDNWDRLIYEATDHNPLRQESVPEFCGAWITTDIRSTERDKAINRGIAPIVIDSWDRMPELLFTICQKAAAIP